MFELFLLAVMADALQGMWGALPKEEDESLKESL